MLLFQLISLIASGSDFGFSRNLRTVSIPEIDTSQNSLYPIGVLDDIYVHFDIDPDLITTSRSEGDLVEYIMSLTDIWNRDTFNSVNINLVVAGFSINAESNPTYSALRKLKQDQPLREGEEHMWVHVNTGSGSSASYADRFGLFYGKTKAYASVIFAGNKFPHMDLTTGPHEIGHLFGLLHTDQLSLGYNHVDVAPDWCGQSPSGGDCKHKPAIGGTVMSYCGNCPGPVELSAFHPFNAAQLQDDFANRKSGLADISFQKLRTFIPSQASRNRCASQGRTCSCNGVVYFGPTVSQTSTKIFAVAQVTGSVKCDHGANERFPDPFYGSQKSCYCHAGGRLTDVSYIPTEVVFTSDGTGECAFTCPRSRNWCDFEFYHSQPEWKCKQNCVADRYCIGYNWKNGDCRFYQSTRHYPPYIEDGIIDQTGDVSGSTCWRRPDADIDAAYPQPQYSTNGVPIVTNPPRPSTSATPETTDRVTPAPSNGDNCFVAISSSECPQGNGRSLPECSNSMNNGDLCEADRALPDGQSNYNVDNCDVYDVFRYICGSHVEPGCSFVALRGSECPADNGRYLPKCSDNTIDGELCEANAALPDGQSNYDINNCGYYDIFRKTCGSQPANPTWNNWSSWGQCSRSCGSGVQHRSRSCSGSGCAGDASESKSCRIASCSTPTWRSWSSWGQCSVTCGTGVQRRTRSCSERNCAGDSSESKSCTTSCSDVSFRRMGTGVCTSNSGEYTDGIGSSRKTASQCRRECERRSDCWGYTAVESSSASRSGTCYVHGHYDRNDAGSSWFEASGTAQVISDTSGSYGLACYKRS